MLIKHVTSQVIPSIALAYPSGQPGAGRPNGWGWDAVEELKICFRHLPLFGTFCDHSN